LDTFAENDDLVIGVRGLMNDYYARDMSGLDTGKSRRRD
jgi:hypothetical protein